MCIEWYDFPVWLLLDQKYRLYLPPVREFSPDRAFTRAIVRVPAVAYAITFDGIGYLPLDNFNESSTRDITAAIRTTGQIFVSATTSAHQGDSSMAVNMAWSPSAPSVQLVRSDGVQGASSKSSSAAFAVARSAEADTALLFVPYPDADPAQVKEISDGATRTTSLVWTKKHTTEPSHTWQCQLVLASANAIDEAEAAARAIDYTEPGSVRIEVGRAQSGATLRSDGFEPGTGCFHVATDGNRARMVVEGKKRPSFSPAFQVDGGSNDQAWVYVNYLVHPSVFRGSRGEVIFQLPGTVTKEIVVEPLFKKAP